MIRSILVWIIRTGFAFLVGSVVVVAIFRIVPPAITPLMIWRLVQAPFTGHSLFVRHHWVSYDNISPSVFRAVIGGEDAGFLRHQGVDWKAVERAKRVNASRVKRGKPPLGASTISMQTAKNVFLVPWRSMVRKAFEVYFVYLIEALWGKKRIVEVYANMIEWGDGVYGIGQASLRNFGVSASALTPEQASLLGAIVPNPRRFHADAPSSYTSKRASWIRGRMRGVALPK
ncbi:MAG: monofunctional biosynthetic peptidoglycan transglycosylase [Candidatus Kapabacteria bacterium]|nr:monofunctional biosynthetic peptidoglycan transglycosylase [Candidatus Kapabacteria bacterium]